MDPYECRRLFAQDRLSRLLQELSRKFPVKEAALRAHLYGFFTHSQAERFPFRFYKNYYKKYGLCHLATSTWKTLRLGHYITP